MMKLCTKIMFMSSRRCLSKNSIEQYLNPSTKGVIDSWIKKYEDFVGLTQVREAQSKVLEAEAKFEEVQERRRNANRDLTVVNSKLKAVAVELEKTSRGTDHYLQLVTKENDIIKEENALTENVKMLEEQVKSSFALLSSALRDSHEKERAQGERTKYWSIIGSVVGAVLGILGTTFNNYKRMKELRAIVQSSTGNTEDYKKIAMQMCDAVKSQNSSYESFLSDIRLALDSKSNKTSQIASSPQINDLMDVLKSHNVQLFKEISSLKQIIGERAASTSSPNVIYVGPKMEELLSQTEKNLEWKIKLSSLATVTFIYGAVALTLPIILSFFTKGS